MPKLSETQKRVLRTMLDFDCGVRTYEGMQFDSRGRAQFHGEVARHPTRRFVSINTVRALVKRGLLVETKGPWDPPLARHLYVLTDLGRRAAGELEEQNA